MKKRILILLCCSMFIMVISCAKENNKDSKNIDNNIITEYNTTPTNNDTKGVSTEENTNTLNKVENISPQNEFYLSFQTSVNSNPYDKWLAEELSNGERAEKEIYSEYLILWKQELLFTIETAEKLFENKDIYSQWKSELEQWLIHTQEVLKVEMNLMGATMPQLEVIIPHCELIRQKVVDTKKFVYYLENEKLGTLDINPSEFSIIWKNDNK